MTTKKVLPADWLKKELRLIDRDLAHWPPAMRKDFERRLALSQEKNDD